MKKSALPLVLALPFLSHCAAPISTDTPSVSGLSPYPFYEKGPSGSLSAVTIPVLRSPALERRWGKPELTVLADGGYMLRYFQDSTRFETLTILGSPKAFPSPIQPDPYSQSYGGADIQPRWQGPLTIAGKSVRFAQSRDISGADPLEFSTETFSLTAPDGRTASYRLLAETNLETEARQAASYLTTASW